LSDLPILLPLSLPADTEEHFNFLKWLTPQCLAAGDNIAKPTEILCTIDPVPAPLN
jgi:hypothetical protein